MGGGKEAPEGGDIYIYIYIYTENRSTLLYSRNQHNTVKQLFSNLKINKTMTLSGQTLSPLAY